MQDQLQKGMRVRLSTLAVLEKVHVKQVDRVGTVVGGSRTPGCVTVIWDGQKTRYVYSEEYLKLIEEGVAA